jgi:uncharacterized protein with PhoU and TrkA domain
MRKLLFAAALLAGCSSSTMISEIQQAAITACAFEPTAASVAAIISATNATETKITTIAATICKLVTAEAGPEKAVSWVYPGTGVIVQGGFVAKGTRI